MKKSVKILVIDDDEIDRLIYTEYLKSNGVHYNTLFAYTVDEGIELCSSFKPDCILLDYHLPGKNGLEFLKEIAKIDNRQDIPVIMFTGQGAEKIAVNALKSGAKDYLIKNELNSHLLNKTIKNALQNRELEKKICKQQSEINTLAYHDSLTSLLNRHSFYNLMDGFLSTASRNEEVLALLFIDLNNFKFVNDTYGHHIGDMLLKLVSEKITMCLRKGEIISRFGGDEFVIGLPNIPSPKVAANVAQKLIDVICADYQIDHIKCYIGASIGIAIYPNNGNDLNALVKCADQSMYAAKKQDGNAYCFFTKQLQDEVTQRVELENILRHNLNYRENIFLQYQPQYNTQTGDIVAFEALLRCHDKRLGFISPEKLISVAQDIGLQHELGKQIIDLSFRDYKQHISPIRSKPRLSINASPTELSNPDYINVFKQAVNLYDIEPQYIEIEVTESTAINSDSVFTTIESLRNMGARISLDDFGTGYSSLAQLRDTLPLNTIKIDKMFVRDMELNPNNYNVVKSIISISDNFGLDVVAEGVEKECHIKELRKLGCQYLQGFFLKRPMSVQDIKEQYH